MTYTVSKSDRIEGSGLRKPGVARQLAAGATSANTALSVGCQRISVLAVTADIRYSLGTVAQTANASTSHFIKAGERLELDVPLYIDVNGNFLAPNIAIIRDASTSGTLEVTEFI